MQTEMIALQLYTVRAHTASDILGTLRQLAEMGYRAVEFAGYANSTPREIRAALDDYGLRAISAHVPFTGLEADPQQVLGDLQTLGCQFAVVPSLPKERRADAGGVGQVADTFNRWGELCRARGMRFGYHNHAFEFEPLGDSTLFEQLAAGTDPALVDLELDIFWAHHAGADPIDLIGRYGERMPLLHVKDMAPDAERSDAPVGEGILPWPRILAAGAAAGTQYYIVEQDHPKNPLEDVRTSLRNLEQMDLPGRD